MRRIEPEPGFALIEWVMAFVLASIVGLILVPRFTHRRERVAKTETRASLEVLRSAVDAYAAESTGEYPASFSVDLVSTKDRAGILHRLPEEKWTPSNRETLDPTPDDSITDEDVARSGVGGWMYNPKTGDVRLNLVGADFEGETYSSY